MTSVRLGSLLVISTVALSCGGREETAAPLAIRLVDRFDAKSVVDPVAPAAPPARTEWRFDGPAPEPPPPAFAATRGWEAGPGITGLTITQGTLTGRMTSPVAMVRIERTSDRQVADQLHSIEIRMRVSAKSRRSRKSSG
jgi:hypothetical protein